MAQDGTDLQLTEYPDYYDIGFGNDGDFALTKGLDTSLVVSFFTDARASASEVSIPEYRSGWWGNQFTEDDFEIGSKIWLLFQETNQDLTLNNARDFAERAFQWMLDDDYADDLAVSGTRSLEGIQILIRTNKGPNITETVFRLYNNTGQ